MAEPTFGREILPLQAFPAVGVLLLIPFVWFLSNILYHLYLSPLARFPGPKLWAISRIPSQLSILGGHAHLDVLALHKRYGPAIRISPNTVAFNTPQAWRDVNGFRPGHKVFVKDTKEIIPPPNGVDNMVTTTDIGSHTRQRRLINPAFTERSIKGLEGPVTKYVDELIAKLREQSTAGKGGLDIKAWLNAATFDIAGDVLFSEPFGSLRDGELHPWIKLIFNSVKLVVVVGAVNQFPLLSAALRKCIPKSIIQQGIDHFNYSAEKVDRRLDLHTDRPDAVAAILKSGLSKTKGQVSNDERLMSREELHSNAFVLIVAGSETSATLLSGCVFYLCKNPSAMKRLTDEILSSFSAGNQMTFAETAKLPFLNAVIEESLRMYPPLVTCFGRLVPAGGDTVDGHWLPEKTTVQCHQYASYHFPSNFTSPDEFLPERWLGNNDPRFAEDKKDVFYPFLLGPNACLGKDLAYAEIRLILAKLFFNFDVELCSESKDWANQKVYLIWDKPPLMVVLRERAIVSE